MDFESTQRCRLVEQTVATALAEAVLSHLRGHAHLYSPPDQSPGDPYVVASKADARLKEEIASLRKRHGCEVELLRRAEEDELSAFLKRVFAHTFALGFHFRDDHAAAFPEGDLS